MTALTTDRVTQSREGRNFADPLADGALIYSGAMYALDDAGNAAPATADGGHVRAVALQRADASGGDTHVNGLRTVFGLSNSSTAPVTRADIGKSAFVEDDQTVAKTGAAIAGVIVDVDDAAVWVDIGVAALA
jgi:hypothetical protein